ncbi:dihydrodipicolinate synthase family protein [Thermoanaerobacterium thermosaccharolyticum]|uniref:dihydrodipicolinate synthase family protein n=1 Tax=Thermoanaerobacterium thermosaccharolyticum TaxID=1517 RepID=UPI003DA911CE
MQNKFYGIIPPVLTIFNDDGSIDWDGNKKLIDYLIKNGVNALFFEGSVGEFTQLSLDERRELAKFAVDYVDGRLPVIIGCGSCSTYEAIDLAKYAEKIGADAIAVVTPYYWPLNDIELYEHFANIALNIEIPIILYNIPMVTGQNLSPSLISELVKKFPNIIGIKDTIDSVAHMRNIIALVKQENPDFRVLTGFDDHILNILALGGDGAIAGCCNFAAYVLVNLYTNFKMAKYDEFIKYYHIVRNINSIFDLDESIIGVLKEACSQVVGVNNFVRPPILGCSKENAKKINKILKSINLL